MANDKPTTQEVRDGGRDDELVLDQERRVAVAVPVDQYPAERLRRFTVYEFQLDGLGRVSSEETKAALFFSLSFGLLTSAAAFAASVASPDSHPARFAVSCTLAVLGLGATCWFGWTWWQCAKKRQTDLNQLKATAQREQ